MDCDVYGRSSETQNAEFITKERNYVKNLFVKMILIAGTLLLSATMAFPMTAEQPDTGAPIPVPPVSAVTAVI